MDFANRLKGKLTESIVQELLVDAGYRVINSGIETIVRELSCLENIEYSSLACTPVLRKMPDFIIMDKNQANLNFVEVKFRQEWSSKLLQDIKEQVMYYQKLILVCFNGYPITESEKPSGGTHLRCIELKYEDESYLANKYKDKNTQYNWVNIDENSDFDWFDLSPLQYVFREMESLENKKRALNEKTLKASQSILAIRDKNTFYTGTPDFISMN